MVLVAEWSKTYQIFACPRVRGTPLAKILVKSTDGLGQELPGRIQKGVSTAFGSAENRERPFVLGMEFGSTRFGVHHDVRAGGEAVVKDLVVLAEHADDAGGGGGGLVSDGRIHDGVHKVDALDELLGGERTGGVGLIRLEGIGGTREHEAERSGAMSLGGAEVHAILGGRDKEIPVVPLSVAELGEQLLGNLDVGLCSAVGLRMVRRDGAVIETKVGLEFVHGGIDKLGAVVGLDDPGEAEICEDLVEVQGDGGCGLVRDGTEQGESGGNVSDDKEKVVSIGGGRERSRKIDGEVIEGEFGVDRIQWVKSLTDDVELLTRLTLAGSGFAVLEK